MITALSDIDVALWDLKGKYFEAPVHVLMSGASRKCVRACAMGTSRRGAADAIDDIVGEVKGYVREGFSAVSDHSEANKIADMAAAFGDRCVPHVWGTGAGLAAALQLIAVFADNPPRHAPLAPMLEFDRSEHAFRQAVLTTPIEADAGIVVPEAVGLGIASDRGALERFRKTPDRC